MSRLNGQCPPVTRLQESHTLPPYSSISAAALNPTAHTHLERSSAKVHFQQAIFVDYFSSWDDISVAFDAPVILTHLHFWNNIWMHHTQSVICRWHSLHPLMQIQVRSQLLFWRFLRDFNEIWFKGQGQGEEYLCGLRPFYWFKGILLGRQHSTSLKAKNPMKRLKLTMNFSFHCRTFVSNFWQWE